jgi:5'-phosphate synthase pdxT subunit
MDSNEHRPVLGTCAGAILLASPGTNRAPFIGASIARNAWGRQRQSFEATIEVHITTPPGDGVGEHRNDADRFNRRPLPVAPNAAALEDEGFPGVFIRAPRFDTESVDCQTIASLGEEAVGVLDGNRMALTFHPELTLDRRFHRWLLTEAERCKGER